MTGVDSKVKAEKIIAKALEEGACLAGIARINDLKNAPAFKLAPKMPNNNSIANRDSDLGLKSGEVAWPEDGKSVLIIAIEHPRDEPVLDWWENRKATPGNRILIKTVKRVSKWIDEDFGMKSYPVVYHVEKGGIFLKDSAVLAGIGIIGKNNLLLTEKYGADIRLRALILTEDLPSSTPLLFDPCIDCEEFCKKACPQNAFEKPVFSEKEMGQSELPARDGSYSRDKCNIQMEIDIENSSIEMVGEPPVEVTYVKYCRACEFSCPVGR